jgi:hypothetical protein
MTFEPRHDADLLGPLLADPADASAPGGKLASLADVLAFVMQRDSLPRKPAMEGVLGKLQPTLPLYLTQRDEYAVRVGDDREWIAAVEAARAKTLRNINRAPAYSATRWGGNQSQFDETITTVPACAADPGLYGPEGALQLLTASWLGTTDTKLSAALIKQRAVLAGLSIPMIVAAELFGYGVGNVVQLEAVGASKKTASQKIEPRPAIGPPEGKKGNYEWANDTPLLVLLNDQLDALVQWYAGQPNRASKKVSSARADLANAWSVSASNIKQQTTGDPRKRAETARQSAVVRMAD